jgi:hypothetical protein
VSVLSHVTEYKGGKGLTSDITAIIRSVRKVHRYLNVRELFRRKGNIKHITVPHPEVGLEVMDAGIQVGELQRYEIRSRVDLQFRKSRE